MELTGLVASHASTAAGILLAELGLGGCLLGSVPLADARNGSVYSPRGRFGLSVGVQFGIISCTSAMRRERTKVRDDVIVIICG